MTAPSGHPRCMVRIGREGGEEAGTLWHHSE